MPSRTKQITSRTINKGARERRLVDHPNTPAQQEMDDRLHEALIMSFDCGDPVALQIA